MHRISEKRTRIYDHFDNSVSCQKYFFAQSRSDLYTKYYTAMYLIQDTTEGLTSHINRGFNNDPQLAYIEMWGVMQAITIQQDSISTLYRIVTNNTLTPRKNSNWIKIRRLRNQCSGHPLDQNGRYRSFFGREKISYENLRYERKDKRQPEPEFININYAQLISDYANEATSFLNTIVETLGRRWPITEQNRQSE